MFVETKTLPEQIKNVLKQVDFYRELVEVVSSENVSIIGGCAFEGNRSFVAFVDLRDGRSRIFHGSWNGPNPFESKIADQPGTISLIENSCIVTGENGGRGSFATVHLHPNNIAKFLPQPEDVTDREKAILACFRLKSGPYRNNALAGYKSEEIDALVQRGFLAKDGRGVRITAKGKNHQGKLI
jgi:hypothetical protein